MNRKITTLAILLTTALCASQVWAWGSANRFGGSTMHSAGEGTEHTNAWGGSSAHAWGGGSEHTNAYGGTTAGRYGEGAYHAAPSGATAYHPPGYPAYHPPGAYPPPPVYHPPVAIPYYSAGGCYGCAAAAGAVVGMAVGASVASANSAAATSNAYAAGVAAGAASAPIYAMGLSYAALPPNCVPATIRGTTYYLLHGNTWFKPMFGANGVYYQVVTAP